jgi:hypothetical protein
VLELVAPDGPGSAGATLVAPGADDAFAEMELVLAVKPDRALRRRLQAAGFARGPRLLHIPDVEGSRFVFPLGGAEASFALRTVVPAAVRERSAVRVLGLVPVPVGPTSTVFTRGRAPFEWLARLEPPQARCTAVIARAWRASGASVLYRFAGGRDPDAVVKLGGGSAAEVEALHLLRADAVAAGGARLPEVRQRSEVDRLTLVVQTPVDGVPAPRALAGDREAARRLLDDIAVWLEAWAERTARPRELAAEDAKRLVLGPASALAPLLGAAAIERLESLCEAAVGRPIPFVAAHNDLTAANVLLARGAPPGCRSPTSRTRALTPPRPSTATGTGRPPTTRASQADPSPRRRRSSSGGPPLAPASTGRSSTSAWLRAGCATRPTSTTKGRPSGRSSRC